MRIKIVLEKLNLIINVKSIIYLLRRIKTILNIDKETMREIKEIYKGKYYGKAN